jgi:hypothetical protein
VLPTKRRRKDFCVGLEPAIGNHSFRASGITDYLERGGDINIAKRMAGHRNVKTTELYDRRGDEVSFSEIERVGIQMGAFKETPKATKRWLELGRAIVLPLVYLLLVIAEHTGWTGAQRPSKPALPKAKRLPLKRIASKAKTILSVLFLCFLTATLAGYVTGRTLSPDYYGDPVKAYPHIVNWVAERVKVEDTTWKVDGDFAPNGITTLELTGGKILMSCGTTIYRSDLVSGRSDTSIVPNVTETCKPYDESSELSQQRSELFTMSVDLHYSYNESALLLRRGNRATLPSIAQPSLDRTSSIPRRGLFEKAVLVALGAKEVYPILGTNKAPSKFVQAVSNQSAVSEIGNAVKVVAAVVSGFSLGVVWGYEDAANCDSEAFRKQLGDPKFWMDVGSALKARYRFRFTSDSHGTVTTLESSHENINLRDVYLPVRAARLIDCFPVPLHVSKDLMNSLSTSTENAATGNDVLEHYDLPESYYFGRYWWVRDGKDVATWSPIPATIVECPLDDQMVKEKKPDPGDLRYTGPVSATRFGAHDPCGPKPKVF